MELNVRYGILDSRERNTHDVLIEKYQELEKRVQELEGQQRGSANVAKDLQFQVDEIRDLITNFKKLDTKLASRESSRQSSQASHKEALEEGEIVSSSTEPSQEAVEPSLEEAKEAQFSAGLLRVRDDNKVQSPERQVDRCGGPAIKLAGITYQPARAKFKVTSTRSVPVSKDIPLGDESSNDSIFDLTSNNLQTVGGPSKDGLVQVIIEAKGVAPQELLTSKNTTGLELHQLIKRRLKMDQGANINVIYTQHLVVPSNEKTLWSYGFRYKPNHVAVIPDKIEIGDQLRMAYCGKGKNVNGDEIPPHRRG